MKIRVALQSAIEALISNPLRSFLTMLGIMIGVASVMAMMAISEGAAKQVDEQIASLGASNLTIYPGSSRRGPRSGGASSDQPFTDADVELIRQEPFVTAVAARNSGSVTVISGQDNWSTSLYGTNTDYFTTQSLSEAEGRFFDDREVSSGAAVAIIGKTVADSLFEGTNPVGQTIRANNVPLEIIGVLESRGASAGPGGDRDDVIIVPINTARNRITGGNPTVAKYVTGMEVGIADGYDMTMAQEQLETRLREIRRIPPGGTDDFRVFNIADFIRARSSTQATFGVLLAFTAAVSLIVGGVGVTERTREIGLRMAVGARGTDILGQFLAEALALCLLGGVIGSALGVGAANLAAKLGEFPVEISPRIAIIAIGASALIGLFFGFFPARQAAQLNPIEALPGRRHRH